jgi:hypothetical protein
MIGHIEDEHISAGDDMWSIAALSVQWKIPMFVSMKAPASGAFCRYSRASYWKKRISIQCWNKIELLSWYYVVIAFIYGLSEI